MSERKPFVRRLGKRASGNQKYWEDRLIWPQHSALLRNELAGLLGLSQGDYLAFVQDYALAAWTGQQLHCPKCSAPMAEECTSCGFSPALEVRNSQGNPQAAHRPDMKPIEAYWAWP